MSVLRSIGRLCRDLERAASDRSAANYAASLVMLALGLPPPAMTDPSQASGRTLYLSALAAIESGDLSRATWDLQEAARLLPGSLPVVRRLGSVLRRSGNYREALKVYRTALSRTYSNYVDPAHFLYHDLAYCLETAGRIRLAVKCYERALQLRPTAPDTCFNLGCLYARLGQWSRAESSFERVLTLRPDDAQAHVNLGAIRARQERYDEAARHFEAALQIDDSLVSARENLKRVLAATAKTLPGQSVRAPAPEADGGVRAPRRSHRPASDQVTLVNLSLGSHQSADTYTPLGCLCLISLLRDAGYGVDFRDAQVMPGDTSTFTPELLNALSDDPAPIFGISCMIDMLPQAILLARRVKRDYPGTLTVLGGPGPSGPARELVRAFGDAVDVVVQGEGDRTIVDLVSAYLSAGREGLGGVSGIVFACDGEAVSTPARERVRSLDELPDPAYDVLDLSQYSSVTVSTSRGCPFHCQFCDVAPLWGHRVTFSTPERTGRLLAGLHDMGVRRVSFNDDTFVLNRSRTTGMCRVLSQFPDLNWTCFGRIDLVDRELLQLASDAGCTDIFYGVESGSDRVLSRLAKGFRQDDVRRTVELTVEYMNPVTSFIWGFPDETATDLTETLLLLGYLSGRRGQADIRRLVPLPLSTLYRDRGSSLVYRPGDTPALSFEIRADASLYREIESMIRAHPGIFCGFYSFDTPDYEEKRTIINNFFRYWYV